MTLTEHAIEDILQRDFGLPVYRHEILFWARVDQDSLDTHTKARIAQMRKEKNITAHIQAAKIEAVTPDNYELLHDTYKTVKQRILTLNIAPFQPITILSREQINSSPIALDRASPLVIDKSIALAQYEGRYHEALAAFTYDNGERAELMRANATPGKHFNIHYYENERMQSLVANKYNAEAMAVHFLHEIHKKLNRTIRA